MKSIVIALVISLVTFSVIPLFSSMLLLPFLSFFKDKNSNITKYFIAVNFFIANLFSAYIIDKLYNYFNLPETYFLNTLIIWSFIFILNKKTRWLAYFASISGLFFYYLIF